MSLSSPAQRGSYSGKTSILPHPQPDLTRNLRPRKASSQRRSQSSSRSNKREALHSEKRRHMRNPESKAPLNKARVGAHSNVNFNYLTEEEQNQRYANMRQEYQALQKKVHELEEHFFAGHLKGVSRTKPPLPMSYGLAQLKKARELVQGGEYEMQDCSALIQNLTLLLKKRKLKTSSLEFKMVMALVKRVKRSEESLSYSDGEEEWERELAELSTKEELVEFFTGIRASQQGWKCGRMEAKEKGRAIQEEQAGTAVKQCGLLF